ncbi:hypothetical protein Pta02_50900 [Planobispora takensis]|uniref:Uncharacterized protein n=1 Tax=Planobispora takensis TaxID=1367882 RepID=A0A8J3WXQ0_9ACTN|nr:hypothetical protein Pta02_50900 [Planobispora takensis]
MPGYAHSTTPYPYPEYASKGPQDQAGQGQMLPAELVSTLIGLGITVGPSIVEGILDLFQKQGSGGVARPMSTGTSFSPMSTGTSAQQGQGQGQMIPADLFGTLLDIGIHHGPELMKGILDMFRSPSR